jgi:hypothetical protein
MKKFHNVLINVFLFCFLSLSFVSGMHLFKSPESTKEFWEDVRRQTGVLSESMGEVLRDKFSAGTQKKTIKGDYANGVEIAYYLSFASDKEFKEFIDKKRKDFEAAENDLYKKMELRKRYNQDIVDFISYCYKSSIHKGTGSEEMAFIFKNSKARRVCDFFDVYYQYFELPKNKKIMKGRRKSSGKADREIDERKKVRCIKLGFNETDPYIDISGGEGADSRVIYFGRIIKPNRFFENDDIDYTYITKINKYCKDTERKRVSNYLIKQFNSILNSSLLKEKLGKKRKKFEFCKLDSTYMRLAARLFSDMFGKDDKTFQNKIKLFIEEIEQEEDFFCSKHADKFILKDEDFLTSLYLHFNKKQEEKKNEIIGMREIGEEEGEKYFSQDPHAIRLQNIINNITLLRRFEPNKKFAKNQMLKTLKELANNLKLLGESNIENELLFNISMCVFPVIKRFDKKFVMFDDILKNKSDKVLSAIVKECLLDPVEKFFALQENVLLAGKEGISGIKGGRFENEKKFIDENLSYKIQSLFNTLCSVILPKDFKKLCKLKEDFIKKIKTYAPILLFNYKMNVIGVERCLSAFNSCLSDLELLVKGFALGSEKPCSIVDCVEKETSYIILTRMLSDKFYFYLELLKALESKKYLSIKDMIKTKLEDFNESNMCATSRVDLYKLYFKKIARIVETIDESIKDALSEVLPVRF